MTDYKLKCRNIQQGIPNTPSEPYDRPRPTNNPSPQLIQQIQHQQIQIQQEDNSENDEDSDGED